MSIVLLVLVGGYAALSHYSTVTPGAKGLATALSIGPVLLIGLALSWRWTSHLTMFLIALGVAVLLYENWQFLENHHDWADLGQQCAAYGLVAAAFGRSLMPDRIPLCTQIDQKLHADLTDAELRYTRLATLAWGGFYSCLAVSIGGLFFVATPRVWSLYTNFATFGLIALACLLDYALRQWTLPRRANSGLMSILRRALLG